MGWTDTVLGGTVDFQIERYTGEAWEDTGWADRLSNIGRVSRRMGANWAGEFEAGQWTCNLGDTDYEIWGSLSSLINQKLRFSVRIDGGAWDVQFTGRVVDEQVKDSVFDLNLTDFFEDIKNAHFEWDYASLNMHVQGVSGTEVRFTLENVFQGSFCNGGTVGTGGQIVKFSLGDYSYPVQEEIENETAFLVKSATWSNSVGTIRLSSKPLTTGSGWYSYIRRDLVYSGNPGEIILNILTGTNTNLEWSTDEIDMELWGSGTNSYLLFDFGGTIQGDETPDPGVVLQTLKEICQSSLSEIWFNASGTFSWSAWRPRFAENVYHYREGSQVNNVSWSSSINDIYTRIEVRYGFQSAGDNKYGAVVSRNFPETATTFNYLNRTGTIETQWISNIDEAAVIRDRMGIYYKKGVPQISFESPLFALEGTLDSLIDITARSGSLAANAFEIRSLDKDFNKGQIGIEAIDVGRVYDGKGFARWEDGTVNGTGVPSDTEGSTLVSGTSKSGWAWFNSAENEIGNLSFCLGDGAGTVFFDTDIILSEGDFFTTAPAKGTVSKNLGVGDAPAFLGVNESTGYTYVTNSGDDTVTVIHPTTKAVVATVSVGSNPQGIDVDESGGLVFVADNGDDTVSVIHVASHTLSATIGVGGDPQGLCVEDTLQKVYVTNDGDDTVSVIHLPSQTVSTTISVGDRPYAVRSDETAVRTFVCNMDDDTVSVIDSASDTVSVVVSVGSGPLAVDVDESEGWAFIVCGADNAVHVIHIASDTVSAILTVGVSPSDVACDETDGLTYVTSDSDDLITVIHTNSLTISYTISIVNPFGIVNDEGRGQTFVSRQSDDAVTIIDPVTNNWELLYASTSLSPGTMVVVRGTETTYGQCMLVDQPVYIAGSQMPPMEWLSGKIQGTNAGTVRNIDADLYGTVFRWF